ncbi:MAG: MFS transporter [Rubrobacter sp.]
MAENAREAAVGEPRVTSILAATAVVSAIAGFLYGYDTGIISGALLQITDEFGIGSGWQSVIATGILVGAVIGALVGARFSERFGRKRTILIISAVFVIGTLTCSIAPTPLTLALSRVLLGMAVGGATQTIPMFVAELSPPKIRGRLVLAFQVAIGIGILTATIAGASQLLDWRLMIGLAAAPAALLLVLMLPAPESPRWLVIVDHVGRRRLSLIMTPGAALALLVLGVVFLTGTVSAGSAPFIIACLIAFMFFTAGGLQVMGWLTGSEIYPLGVRGAGTSAQSATLWGSNVLITLTLLPTIEIIGVGPTMWMYAGFNVLAFVFVWRYFPEVAGRSLEDIETSLSEGTFHPGGVPIKAKGKEKAAT